MSKEVLYLGLDVHAENIAVAIAEEGREGEIRNYGEIPKTFHRVDDLMCRLWASRTWITGSLPRLSPVVSILSPPPTSSPSASVLRCEWAQSVSRFKAGESHTREVHQPAE